MATVEVSGERIFNFSVDPLRIEDTQSDTFGLHTSIRFSELTVKEFLELCRSRSLRIGLKIFESSSQSRVLAEFRAVEVAESGGSDSARVRFSIPRSAFADQQCRLAQVDLMYEGKLWFEQAIGAPPFLPIWIEKSPREVDIFDYYFKTYAPK